MTRLLWVLDLMNHYLLRRFYLRPLCDWNDARILR